MLNYIRYEIKHCLGNFSTLIFGFVVPLVMTLIMYNANLSLIPEGAESALAGRLFISFMLMIPLANVLVGFPTAYAQEIEKDITTRTHLFGYQHKQQIIAKLVAQTLILIGTVLLYTLICMALIPLRIPSVTALLALIMCMLGLTIILFIFAYAIATLTKRFSISYSITMTLYFATLILSGMMGLPTHLLPGVAQNISEFLPTTQIINTLTPLWSLDSVSLRPLMQSFGLCSLIGLGFLLYSIRRQSAK